MYPFAILIGGPTASKKTQLAFEIQNKFPSFVVNSDSMQVYNKLKLLTNSPSKTEIKKHSCKLYQFINYPEKCDVAFWLKNVKGILSDEKKRVPIFVGGTGLYLDSLKGTMSHIPKIPKKIELKIKLLHSKLGNLHFYNKLKKVDPKYCEKISYNDSQRLLRAIMVKVATGKSLTYWHSRVKAKLFKKLLYVVIFEKREKLYESINKRCLKILKSSAVDEVSDFLKIRKSLDHPLHKSIGLNFFEDYITGRRSFDETLELFRKDTRQYAKRQYTWFKNRSSDAIKMDYMNAKSYILKNI